jgi:hypothetical protein
MTAILGMRKEEDSMSLYDDYRRENPINAENSPYREMLETEIKAVIEWMEKRRGPCWCDFDTDGGDVCECVLHDPEYTKSDCVYASSGHTWATCRYGQKYDGWK